MSKFRLHPLGWFAPLAVFVLMAFSWTGGNGVYAATTPPSVLLLHSDIEDFVPCKQATLVFKNPTNFAQWFDYRVDYDSGNETGVSDAWSNQTISQGPLAGQLFGLNYNLTKVEANSSVTKTVTFDGGTGIHTVEYRLARGPEQNWYFDWVSVEVETDCVPEVVLYCSEISGPIVATYSNRLGWDLDSETRTQGFYQFVEGSVSTPEGLRVWTLSSTSQDKTAGYYPVDLHVSELGTADSITLTLHTLDGSTPPALQAGTDFDNDGFEDAILVYEPTYYGDNWWTDKGGIAAAFPGLPSGSGYQIMTPLDTLLAVYPNARVKRIGYSLGSGVKGDFIIDELVLGCTSYKFAPDSVSPDEPTFNEPTCANQVASVSFPDNDFVYEVTGETTPGGTVDVEASLKPGTTNKKVVGTTSWSHTFVTIESLNCPVSVTPEDPTVTTIPDGVCGVEGSVTPATTPHITYEVAPSDPIEGFVVVTHEVEDGFVSTNPDWQYAVYLGDFFECVVPTELAAEDPVFEEPTCETPAQVVTSDTDFVTFVITGTVSAGEFVEVGAKLRQSVDPESYTLKDPIYWSHTFVEAPDCTVDPTDLTATAPTFVEQTCSVDAAVVPTEDDYIKYDTDGTIAAGHRVTVTAELRNSVDPTFFEIVGDTTWIHDFAAAPNCTVEPTVHDPVEPTFLEQTCEADATVVTADNDYLRYPITGTVQSGSMVTVSVMLRESVDPDLHVLSSSPTWIHTFAAAPNCDVEPTVLEPVEPTFVEQTCVVDADVLVDDSDFLRYPIEGLVAPGGTVTVTVALRESLAPSLYVLGSNPVYVHTFNAAPDCSDPEPAVAEVNLAKFTAIPAEACEVQGAVTPPADTDQVDYTLIPSQPVSGTVVLLATAKPGFVLPDNYQPQQIDLGLYRECEEPVVSRREITATPPVFTDPTCQDPVAGFVANDTSSVNFESEGEAKPGKAVAVLASEVNPKADVLVGPKFWFHQYPTIQELNCEVPAFEIDTFFPWLVATDPDE